MTLAPTRSGSNGDLTRWNRAGLSRFQYTDGNAANWLELLRERLRQRLEDAGLASAGSWAQLNPDPIPTSKQEALDHIEKQYLTATNDHGWEILRSFARALHVSTAHLDSYTNESSLRTATQWESLRRLVAMLDYSPAPAASASTSVALLLDDGASGTVTKGLQLCDKPTEGAPLTFETLADLDTDSRLNQIQIRDWDKSQEFFVLEADLAASGNYPIAAAVEGLSVGSVAVLQADAESGSDTELVPLGITAVSDDSIGVSSLGAGATARQWKYHQLTLHASPKTRAKPLLAGDNTVIFAEVPLFSGTVMLGWMLGGNYQFVKVNRSQLRRASLDLDAGQGLPPAGTPLYGMIKIERNTTTTYVPLSDDRLSSILDDSFAIISTSEGVKDEHGVLRSESLDLTKGASPHWYLPKAATAVAIVESVSPTALEFSGKPKGITSGSPIVLELEDDSFIAASVTQISETDEGFQVSLDPSLEEQGMRAEHIVAAYWDFQEQIRPEGYNNNTDDLGGEITLSLDIADWADWPRLLDTTREVILYDPDCGLAAAFTIVNVDPEDGTVTLSVEVPGVPDTDGGAVKFTKHNSLLLANVVTAGHGETKNPRVLGSGDSTNTSPEYDLDFDDISFVADATMPNGVRADVEVTIGNRTWNQVGTLRDSVETDSAFDVRSLDQGGLRFRFNRRLPTGANNIQVTVRRGVGLAGNLGRGALVKLKQPHRLVSEVLQPFDATGGSDIEPTASLRENAPESVLTLDRAVSVSDFAALAVNHASVWQAQAFSAIPDRPNSLRGESVKVVAVPAGGGLLGDLTEDLRSMLQSRAMPGIIVEVTDYINLKFDLDIRIRIDTSAYDPDQVCLAVRAKLEAAFTIEQRPLAVGLYRSQVYTVVEAIEGVQDSICGIVDPAEQPLPPERIATTGSGVIRALRARDGELLSLRDVIVTYTEYTS